MTTSSNRLQKIKPCCDDPVHSLARKGVLWCQKVQRLTHALMENREEGQLLHCVRCHEDYDPESATSMDCRMFWHTEDYEYETDAETGDTVWYHYCCGEEKGHQRPCFEGNHILEWKDGGEYWMDEDLEEPPIEGEVCCLQCGGYVETETMGQEEAEITQDDLETAHASVLQAIAHALLHPDTFLQTLMMLPLSTH